ncbi:NADPH-dependent FMN reductase [Bacillus sp. AFS076308]|uniref:NADPH-dependent FMN reductase n=1 Tax=unclassified Bacillus (in: firmicutes) TaxID=185979 RepID=UPI000BFA1111|nr:MULTISPECIES: NAD(P)H-dependent oxidoreductase [unclassified Bacillus (in: firmicutes)]PFN76000.1 NADPH-dependent FMN reductase [Bacillus sp. AFS076308]PGV45973.1 NADPH-dependent FMN reductase [Bacillus sp. AFS037270]
MKIVALVGSLRKDSYNKQLAYTIQERFANKFDLEVLDLGVLPHYNQDEELNPADSVLEFKQKVKEADGVIIITPEYNWSIPGVLKNALDWLSRVDKVLIGKPVMNAGAATGLMGTLRAQLQLRQILTALQVKLLSPVGNEILINQAMAKFDEKTGRLADEATVKFVDEVVERFIDLIKE